jgi:hypothetical protein
MSSDEFIDALKESGWSSGRFSVKRVCRICHLPVARPGSGIRSPGGFSYHVYCVGKAGNISREGDN